MKRSDLFLGYDYDAWYNFGEKVPVTSDVDRKTNSHILICGMSGSGKSYLANQIFARICLQRGKVYFADFKQDDAWAYLRGCSRYFPYDKTIQAVDEVYKILHNRQSGVDTSRDFVTLIWDEYISNILYLQSIDKKKAETTMRKVSEILMLGRSLAVRLICACQRPDATAFPTGSRLNYGIIIIVGAAIKSIYEMLIPKDYTERIGDRQFRVGEGIVLLQSSQIHYIKVPIINDEEQLKKICIEALGG